MAWHDHHKDDYYFACVIVSPLTTSAMSTDMRAPVCTNRYSVQSSTCGLQCVCLHGYCSCQETKGSEIAAVFCSTVKTDNAPVRCQEEGALPVWCQEEGALL